MYWLDEHARTLLFKFQNRRGCVVDVALSPAFGVKLDYSFAVEKNGWGGVIPFN